MIVRAKAPLRLGLAGGGSDINTYCDKYKGASVNITIGLYAHVSITTLSVKKTVFQSLDTRESVEFDTDSYFPTNQLSLLVGVYNEMMKMFQCKGISAYIVCHCDAPIGSGLGTSSAIVVACIEAFLKYLNRELGKYDKAYLAYEIERNILGFSGGKQDQFAACFGGANYMEFFPNHKVVVSALCLDSEFLLELEESIVLFFTGQSRTSMKIIDDQIAFVKKDENINLMHDLSRSAFEMKQALESGSVKSVANTMTKAFERKRKTSKLIFPKHLEMIYQAAMKSGARAGRISGAGGGGFMLFLVDPLLREQLCNELSKYKGRIIETNFTQMGSIAWRVYNGL